VTDSRDTAVRRGRSSPRRVAAEAVRGALRRVRYRVERHVPHAGGPWQPQDEDRRRVQLLADRGVTLLLDGGANIGQYAVRTRWAGYEGRIVSFEPMRAAYAKLSARAEQDPDWECRREGLGSEVGDGEIHVSGNSHSSSLLEMKERHLRSAPGSAYVGSEEISLVTLDSIWDELVGASDRPFLKLDVQGFELEALRGARRSVSRLRGVEAELSLIPLHEGAPTYKEVIDHLEAAGFRLAGLEPGFFDPETAELLQADGIFVRD
jgi:FkbM family methyltransferase